MAVSLDTDGYIDDFHCQCPAYDEYEGMCKLCVAALVALHGKQKKTLPPRLRIRKAGPRKRYAGMRMLED